MDQVGEESQITRRVCYVAGDLKMIIFHSYASVCVRVRTLGVWTSDHSPSLSLLFSVHTLLPVFLDTVHGRHQFPRIRIIQTHIYNVISYIYIVVNCTRRHVK